MKKIHQTERKAPYPYPDSNRLTHENLITLYHFCDQAAYDALHERGYLTGDGRRASRWIRDMPWQPYHWMAIQMEKRLEPKPMYAGKFPIWAWYTRDGKPKPDLRRSGLGKRGERTVMLTVQLPSSQVLLSDEEAWHLVLNNGPCTDNEQEWNDFEEKEKQWPLKKFDEAVRQTWERIFELDRPRDPTWSGLLPLEYVQGCFWLLQREDVISERWFIAQ